MKRNLLLTCSVFLILIVTPLSAEPHRTHRYHRANHAHDWAGNHWGGWHNWHSGWNHYHRGHVSIGFGYPYYGYPYYLGYPFFYGYFPFPNAAYGAPGYGGGGYNHYNNQQPTYGYGNGNGGGQTYHNGEESVVARVQRHLADEGFYQGEIDGNLGPRTFYAIRSYQRSHGLRTTGEVDNELLNSMGLH